MKSVKIGTGAARQGERHAVGVSYSGSPRSIALKRRWKGLPERRARDWLTVRIRYTGGATAAVEVEARGARGLFDGDTCIFDVVAEVNQWHGGPTPDVIDPGVGGHQM